MSVNICLLYDEDDNHSLPDSQQLSRCTRLISVQPTPQRVLHSGMMEETRVIEQTPLVRGQQETDSRPRSARVQLSDHKLQNSEINNNVCQAWDLIHLESALT